MEKVQIGRTPFSIDVKGGENIEQGGNGRIITINDKGGDY